MDFNSIGEAASTFYTWQAGLSGIFGFAVGTIKSAMDYWEYKGFIDTNEPSKRFTSKTLDALAIVLGVVVTVSSASSNYTSNIAAGAAGNYFGTKMAGFFLKRQRRLEEQLLVEYTINEEPGPRSIRDFGDWEEPTGDVKNPVANSIDTRVIEPYSRITNSSLKEVISGRSHRGIYDIKNFMN